MCSSIWTSLSIRTNSQKAEELYLPEHCWWHQLQIQVIAAEMLLIYSRHIQKQHGFGLTKFYFLGQTWWYLNLMIWFEEIKSRVNMSYDFGTALKINKMALKYDVCKNSWTLLCMLLICKCRDVCYLIWGICLPGKSISNQINSNQKCDKSTKSKRSKAVREVLFFFFTESRFDRRVARAQMQ